MAPFEIGRAYFRGHRTGAFRHNRADKITAYAIQTARNILNIAAVCLSGATCVWEI
jgi:hypothetical protein